MSESNEALVILARAPVTFTIHGKDYRVRKMSLLALHRFHKMCQELGVKAFPFADPEVLAKPIEEMTETERDYIVQHAVGQGTRKLAAVTVALRESNDALTFEDVADWFEADNPEHGAQLDRLFNVTQHGTPEPREIPEADAGPEGNEEASVSGAD